MRSWSQATSKHVNNGAKPIFFEYPSVQHEKKKKKMQGEIQTSTVVVRGSQARPSDCDIIKCGVSRKPHASKHIIYGAQPKKIKYPSVQEGSVCCLLLVNRVAWRWDAKAARRLGLSSFSSDCCCAIVMHFEIDDFSVQIRRGRADTAGSGSQPSRRPGVNTQQHSTQKSDNPGVSACLGFSARKLKAHFFSCSNIDRW